MAPAVIDLNAELEETVIADPRTGGDVNVNVELLLRYLRDPKGLSLVRERTWNALGKRDWSSDERQAAVTQEWFDLITTITEIKNRRDTLESKGHSPNTTARTFFKSIS